ncbi:TMV resistance protein N-like [Eucalyptus grandis]|uniref:TMV resistance protein N-like n=1 Tax=Eucalyptus grandis TaxID=71139 RepID=UPI00192EAE5C|nr:TMV resistance protein N-like [Eucalyptus grandis]
MGKHRSKQQRKRVRDTDASSPNISKRPRPDVPSASGANSDPPASSTSVNGNNYYVFLSFRGPDTRKGFVDHLYQRLKAVGLRYHPNFVFRDDEDLPFGENIGENLIRAIERSKVSIPVISENYADSEWCLRELIHIMKCKESRGQMVLPVLYKVTPKDVRKLKGAFGKAYKSCKDKFEEEVKQQGPLALRKAVALKVFESEKFADGHEGELVNELIEIILREQQHDFQPHLPVNLVAINDRVAKVMELMDLACPDTQIIGIWGMGGIGKTTLATIIYKNLFDNFECRSSLKDIRETAKSNKGMRHVQSLLISDMTSKKKSTVRDPEMGINMIRSSCENKKVLILLDDVDHQDQLDKLIGHCNFGSGSRIIITCRDKAILKSEYEMYELKEMNHEDSMLLFSRCAFEEEQPPTDLAALSSNIVATTGGLPLALIVIGSLLKEKDRKEWEETLQKLRNAPNETVQEKLRISYDTLTYKEQQMFLDIACFFIGTDKTIATYFWADLEFFPITGLRILINRSLIKIDDNNQFENA